MKKKTKKALSIATAVVMISSCMSGCHIHNYSKATCTEAAVCKSCGEIKQEALGHTTSFGWCSNCESVVNYELYREMETIYTEISWDSDFAQKMIYETPEIERLHNIIHPSSATKDLQELIDYCNEYLVKFDELIKLIESNPKAMEDLPELKEFYDDLKNIYWKLTDFRFTVENPEYVFDTITSIYDISATMDPSIEEHCPGYRLDISFNTMSSALYSKDNNE